jgi:hypothetical protein
MLVNLERFYAAFGIGSAGFSEGMVCVPPDRPVTKPLATNIGCEAVRDGDGA